MRLLVNGEAREGAVATLIEIWEAEASQREIESSRGFAIALNGRVVPRSLWADTSVSEGDEVEIVRAMSGG